MLQLRYRYAPKSSLAIFLQSVTLSFRTFFPTEPPPPSYFRSKSLLSKPA